MGTRGKKRLLGMTDDECIHYLDYGDGFIVFTEVKVHCVRLSPQEADTTIGSDFKRAFGGGGGGGKPERKTGEGDRGAWENHETTVQNRPGMGERKVGWKTGRSWTRV